LKTDDIKDCLRTRTLVRLSKKERRKLRDKRYAIEVITTAYTPTPFAQHVDGPNEIRLVKDSETEIIPVAHSASAPALTGAALERLAVLSREKDALDLQMRSILNQYFEVSGKLEVNNRETSELESYLDAQPLPSQGDARRSSQSVTSNV
jgi:hypothetical protein